MIIARTGRQNRFDHVKRLIFWFYFRVILSVGVRIYSFLPGLLSHGIGGI